MSTDQAGREPWRHIVASARGECAGKSELIRNTLVSIRLTQARQEGYGDRADHAICTAAGYSGIGDYWHSALSEPMKESSFSHLLATHMLDPYERLNPFDPRPVARQLLDSALRVAWEAGETFFIRRGDETFSGNTLLRPQEATAWLLAQPKRREGVPPSLREYLHNRGTQSSIKGKTKASALGSRRGPAAKVRERVKNEMRKLPPADLRKLTQYEMKIRFNAAESTCRAARDAVLAEFGKV